MNVQKKVLLTEPMHDVGMKILREHFDVVVAPDKSHETLSALVKDADALVVKLTKTRSELLDEGRVLRIVAKHAAGVDDIDVKKATAKGILVVNAGDANAISVAEHALIALGGIFKRVRLMDRSARSCDWRVKENNKSMDLEGATLGLLGMGIIGSLLAQKAQRAFNMNVIAYDPYVKPDTAAKLGVGLVDNLDELCVRADALSIHSPLTPETKNMIDARRISMMKPTAVIVNFARGGIIDEAALYDALKEEKIFGAALDVFAEEPVKATNPLLKLDNVLVSPHAAAYTDESRKRLSLAVAEGLLDYFAGKRPRFAINPQVLQ